MKSGGYLLNNDVTNTIVFRHNVSQKEPANFIDHSTLVVIDNKIYATEDAEYVNLNPSMIKDIKLIKDQKSKTGINAIIFIKMKITE